MNLSVSNIQSSSLNCCNCGAALAAADIVCPHCHSRNAVDLMAIKQFRLLEEQKDEACPNCRTPLTLVALDGFNGAARHCTECKGLFFGPGMLNVILQRISHDVYEINAGRLKNIHEFLIKKDAVVYKPCPVCRELMWRKSALDGCSVISDQCREHGIWLDAGELTVMAEWLEAGGELQVVEEEKIAAKIAAVALPRTALPVEKEPDENAQWNLSVDDPQTAIGFFAGALGFMFLIETTNIVWAFLAMGVVVVAAWLTKPWFAGVSFGACVGLYWQTGRAWPPALFLLVLVAVMGALVVAYKGYLGQDE